jgi:mxaJ protein
MIGACLISQAKLPRRLLVAGAALCASNVMSVAGPVPGAPVSESNEILRVCAANQPPYSIKGGSGFENKIASVVGKAASREIQFVWTDTPAIYLVRDYLDKNTCDVIIGLDTGDPRLTTKPYYRTATSLSHAPPIIWTFIRGKIHCS